MGALVGSNDVHREVRVSALVHLVRVIQRKGDIALVPTHCACVIESQVHGGDHYTHAASRGFTIVTGTPTRNDVGGVRMEV